MTEPPAAAAHALPSPDDIIGGPQWPARMTVVRVERMGVDRVRIEAVPLAGDRQLVGRVLTLAELAAVTIEPAWRHAILDGDPNAFRLAAEATRIRLAYTYDPQFAVTTMMCACTAPSAT